LSSFSTTTATPSIHTLSLHDALPISWSTIVQEIQVMHTVHLTAISPEINEGLRALHQQQHPLTLVTVSQSCAHSYADYTPFDYVDRKSTRLNSSHQIISYAVFCLKKK